MTRRDSLKLGIGALARPALAQSGALTKFQIACMTLPYSPFPFERALEGIASAGYKFAAWGNNHPDKSGKRAPLIEPSEPPKAAADLAATTRAAGLEPVMMFSTVNLEEPDAGKLHAMRVEQAAAARIPFVLTFGRTRPGEYENAIRCLKYVGPIARKAGVTVVVKQHGGNTATGQMISRMLRDTGEEAVLMCYDAGNVLDYEDNDPIPDIQECWRDIRAFAIKDHRNWPKDEDCGPGFGEIDHYRLLTPVARTGLTMPLACENIFEPLLERPKTADGVDALARRAREFLETVTRGIQQEG
ncbi:MAG: TIM barrel protein [Bryobacteraceae bacterium]|nr:TIM barrel protein [Bryobacteraceae bacterium]